MPGLERPGSFRLSLWDAVLFRLQVLEGQPIIAPWLSGAGMQKRKCEA